MKPIYIATAFLFVLVGVAYVFGHLGGPASATLTKETLNSRAPIVKAAPKKKYSCCRKMLLELQAIVEKHLKSR